MMDTSFIQLWISRAKLLIVIKSYAEWDIIVRRMCVMTVLQEHMGQDWIKDHLHVVAFAKPVITVLLDQPKLQPMLVGQLISTVQKDLDHHIQYSKAITLLLKWLMRVFALASLSVRLDFIVHMVWKALVLQVDMGIQLNYHHPCVQRHVQKDTTVLKAQLKAPITHVEVLTSSVL